MGSLLPTHFYQCVSHGKGPSEGSCVAVAVSCVSKSVTVKQSDCIEYLSEDTLLNIRMSLEAEIAM